MPFSGKGQLAVLDALDACQGVGEFLNVLGATPHDDHLEAVVVVEVNVQRRNDQVAVVMLHLGNFVGERARVMIVNHGDRGGHLRLGIAPLLLDQRLAHQIAYRFGAVGIPLALVALVESGKQILGDGNGVAFEVGHEVGLWRESSFLEDSITGFDEGEQDRMRFLLPVWVNAMVNKYRTDPSDPTDPSDSFDV